MVLEKQTDLKAIHRLLLWAILFPFFTPEVCSHWPQTNLAADLPYTKWLKCDHPSGSPVFSLCEHETNLPSSSAYPQKYKELFLSPSPTHKDKQENRMAGGLGYLRETTRFR